MTSSRFKNEKKWNYSLALLDFYCTTYNYKWWRATEMQYLSWQIIISGWRELATTRLSLLGICQWPLNIESWKVDRVWRCCLKSIINGAQPNSLKVVAPFCCQGVVHKYSSAILRAPSTSSNCWSTRLNMLNADGHSFSAWWKKRGSSSQDKVALGDRTCMTNVL